MKKVLSVLSVLVAMVSLLFTTSCGGNSGLLVEGKLYVAVSPDYAPYEFIDSTKSGQEQYVGADIEFAKYLAKELGLELVIEAVNFDLALSALDTGKVDLAISGFTYSDERAANYTMSKGYYEDGDGDQVVITLKENATKYATFEGLNKSTVKVGAQVGSVQHDYVEQQLPNANLQDIDTITNGVLYLVEGKIDALAISSEAADSLLATDAYKNSIVVCEEQFEVDDSHLYAIAKKGNTVLMEKVNEVIEKVVAENMYATWMVEAKELFVALGDNAKEEAPDA